MLQVENVCKDYETSEVRTHAVVDVSLEIDKGEFVAIMGPSGCGKSTLLNILGLLDRPDSGRIAFMGEEVSGGGEGRLTQLRRNAIGFVFQSFNLIEELTVEQNVALGLVYRGLERDQIKTRVSEALDQVEMGHRAKHRPRQLSGGQQQRIAVARALAARPQLILADEPTGNLDTINGNGVLSLLRAAVGEGASVVMVTHSLSQADWADRKIQLLDGQVVAETAMRA